MKTAAKIAPKTFETHAAKSLLRQVVRNPKFKQALAGEFGDDALRMAKNIKNMRDMGSSYADSLMPSFSKGFKDAATREYISNARPLGVAKDLVLNNPGKLAAGGILGTTGSIWKGAYDTHKKATERVKKREEFMAQYNLFKDELVNMFKDYTREYDPTKRFVIKSDLYKKIGEYNYWAKLVGKPEAKFDNDTTTLSF